MALLRQIPKTENGNRFILGLDGLSRSGKTTLGDELSKHFKVLNIPFHVFHMDDHIVVRENRYNTEYEPWIEYYHLQWDIEWLSQNFFKQLKTARQIHMPFYDTDSDTQSFQSVLLPSTCIILIEGVFLQREEWRDYFDTVVYLNCTREKRFLRENHDTQMNLHKLQHRYWKAEEFYLMNEFPMDKANLVLQG